MVVADLWLTPIARYADIVLPVTSAAERSDITRLWPSEPDAVKCGVCGWINPLVQGGYI